MVYDDKQRSINRMNVMIAIVQHQYNYDIKRLSHEYELASRFYEFVNNRIKCINKYVNSISSLTFYINYINLIFYETDISLATSNANEIFTPLKIIWKDMRSSKWYLIENNYYHKKYLILVWSIRQFLPVKDLLLTIKNFIY